MKKTILLFLVFNFLFCVTFSYSQNINSLTTVSFEGAKDGDWVYLELGSTMKDSARIEKKLATFLSSKLKNGWNIYFISCPSIAKTYKFPLLLNEKSNLSFSVNRDLNQISISGDINSYEQNDFYDGLGSQYKRLSNIQNLLLNTKDSTELIKLSKQLDDIKKDYENYIVNWVNTHKGSPFSVAVIRLFINKTNTLNKLDLVASKCFNELLPTAKDNNSETEILQRNFSLYDDRYSFFSVNDAAPDFTLKDTSGNEITLRMYKGKWLLIDFWASWCAPCRANNPLLKSIYNEYKKIGLNVLSISADTDTLKWKAAIIEDEMYWQQASDLLGMYTGVLFKYHINAIPFYFLISPEGRIITKSISGDIRVIKNKLNEVFKEQK